MSYRIYTPSRNFLTRWKVDEVIPCRILRYVAHTAKPQHRSAIKLLFLSIIYLFVCFLCQGDIDVCDEKHRIDNDKVTHLVVSATLRIVSLSIAMIVIMMMMEIIMIKRMIMMIMVFVDSSMFMYVCVFVLLCGWVGVFVCVGVCRYACTYVCVCVKPYILYTIIKQNFI